MLAPIVLFVYNRPWHTRQTLESLMLNELASESQLFIYADGPKETASKEEIIKIQEVRQVIREKKWCKSVTIIESDKNQGLASSIIKGVTQIVDNYEKIIVLEDDMLTSKYFLKFMNNAFELYQYEDAVACISGYVHPIEIDSIFFIRGADIWGWGTWKRAWDLFEYDAKQLLQELKDKNLTYRFDMNGTLDCTGILKAQIDGKVSSWGIRWYASAFLAGKLHLYPPKPLIQNIGFDGSGTHCGISDFKEAEIFNSSIEVNKIEIQENQEALQYIINYYDKLDNPMNKKNLINKFLTKKQSMLKKIRKLFK